MTDEPEKTARRDSGRRRFLATMAGAACSAALAGGGLSLYARQARALPAYAIRPPGALDEEHFLGACVRCGLCVRNCPYDTLKLSELGEPVATGTPYFEPRTIPCEMCTDVPCAQACPTGALDHELRDIDKARMGLAVLVDHENCLNFLGMRCDVFYRVCPLIDKAITLDLHHNERTGKHAMFIPTVHADKCTGCGKCEKSCVLEESAIKVLPLKLARGEPGRHYRLGWEEKRKAGGSLIPEQVQLPVRRPGAQP